jgi:hypothetical protein
MTLELHFDCRNTLDRMEIERLTTMYVVGGKCSEQCNKTCSSDFLGLKDKHVNAHHAEQHTSLVIKCQHAVAFNSSKVASNRCRYIQASVSTYLSIS